MILCLDVGNTTIHAGVYKDGSVAPSQRQLLAQFRRTSESRLSSDEIGLFLRAALRENGIDPKQVTQIAIASVVPDIIHSMRGACTKYFNIQPFLLQAGVKTGLKIKYSNPLEVGADRIANAIAGSQLYPKRDLIIVDFGTATTFDVINASREYLGGVILAGLRLSIEALEQRTAKLPSVEIISPKSVLARSTVESMQSGLFFGTIGQIKEISERLHQEAFAQASEPPLLIATGGFAGLFEGVDLFDHVVSDLVLKGLLFALEMNGTKTTMKIGVSDATQHAEV